MSDVEDLIDQAEDLPYGQAKSVLLEKALRLAEATGEREQALAARLDLTEAYQYGGEPGKSFTTFSRSVADYDADPARFGEWQVHTLLWQFKWIAGDMRRFPEIPLARAYDGLAEMERRYREAGHGLHVIYAQRCHVAQHIGDRAAAEEWFHKWQTAPRDEMSDCEGCDPGGKVWHLAWTGCDEDAIELAAPVVAGELTCHVQPQGILSNLLLPYVRTGRLSEAAAAHLKAYRLVQGDVNYVDDFGDHMEFCALTGNETRGLEILERELPLLERSPTPSDLMHFASCAALLLRRVEEIGDGSLTVRRAGTDVPVPVLRQEMEQRARDLGARFDARNGTDEQSRRVAARLAAEPLVEHLPLVPHARRVAFDSGPAAVLSAVEPGDLLDVAEQAWRRGDIADTLAAFARFEELYGSRELDPVSAARLAEGAGLAAAVQEDHEGAAGHWARAAELYARAGDEPGRHAALSRVGGARCGAGAVDEGLALLAESHGYLREHGDRRQRDGATARLAACYADAGRPAEALALIETAIAEGSAEPPLHLMLANVLAADERRLPEAVRAAARAREALREPGGGFGGGFGLAKAALLHANLMRAHGCDVDDLLGAYAEVLSAAPRSEPGIRAVAHATRGETLVMLDRGAEAADDLIEAVAAFTALGSAANAALARVDLASAYLMTDRPAEAVITAEEALALLDPGDAGNRAAVRWARAGALRELNDLDGALAEFAALAGEYTDDLQAARALEAQARVLDRLDRDEEAARAFEAAAQRYGAAGDQAAVGRTLRRQALSLYWSDESEAALAVAGRARAALDPEDHELAVLAYDEARILHALDRTEEAAARCEEAVALFGRSGDEEGAERAEELLQELR